MPDKIVALTEVESMSELDQVFINVCHGELFEFGGPPATFRPCGDCEWWGHLDGAPDWVVSWHAEEYAYEIAVRAREGTS